MNRKLGELSGRARITLVSSLLLSVLLIGFVGLLSYRITTLDVADETAASRESNQNIRNMLAQTNAILKNQAKNWATDFRARFASEFSLTPGDLAPSSSSASPLRCARLTVAAPPTQYSNTAIRPTSRSARATS